MNTINQEILYALLQHFPHFVSGESLAEHLKISRVSIWGHLEKLRSDGFQFEALRNKGYRLLEEPTELHPDLLKAYLNLYTTDCNLLFFEELDSTNTEAERQLAAQCEVPLYIISKLMSNGRGRRGRKWFSSDSGNMYLTVAYKPNLALGQMSLFTLWIATEICHFFNNTLGLAVKIKWPNDLVYEGKKFMGILTEARIDSEHTRDLIVGIGLNINSNFQQWPIQLQKITTSLQKIANKTWNMNALVAQLIKVISTTYEKFFQKKDNRIFHKLWENYDHLKGQPISIESSQTIYTGIADGIDSTGKLILRTSKNNERMVFDSGEVTIVN
jgi:BirA family biotin operon repressor/biotin-[acetyl-CoA-carboxylase] ligase